MLLGKYGRRTIHLSGLTLLAVVLVACGVVAVAGLDEIKTGWIEGSLLLLYTFIYGCTIGPVTYALVSEMSSTRTKSKTINIARMGYNAFGVFNCVVTPYQLNPTALDWGGKTAWFWFGFCVLCLAYSYFRIPEPRNRTYAEMDWLFAEGVSARNFASTHVPKFGEMGSKDGLDFGSEGKEGDGSSSPEGVFEVPNEVKVTTSNVQDHALGTGVVHRQPHSEDEQRREL